MTNDTYMLAESESFQALCAEYKKNNRIDPALYERFDVKRGLRNQDGTGVVAGLTNICNVHGYVVDEGEKKPIDGELIYRGININDLVGGAVRENRFGFEEIIYLLVLGKLPTASQLASLRELMGRTRVLPDSFVEDMIFKAPSPNIMNKLGRSILALYSYDKNPEDCSIENEIRKAIELISRLPNIMINAYQIKRRVYDRESMFMHLSHPSDSIAENILSKLRPDRVFTDEEAKLLDVCLMLHAEHGGGNNSTFTCRCLTSSGTDSFSAYAAAIGALKGPRHGGANIKVMEMLHYMEEGISDWSDDGQVKDFLQKIIRGEAGDGSGLIYGMGHAVYTKSDPRAVILKQNAMKLAKGTDIEKEFLLLDAVERLSPEVYHESKSDTKMLCANVDLYSGLVYQMLRIPPDLFTPLFAVARMPGWCAHRMEELLTGRRIMRPAYKAIAKEIPYVPLADRV